MIKRHRTYGFTIIELLAAVAILGILVAMMGKVFADASKAWKLGTESATDSATGRAIMDLIVRDLSAGVADDLLGFRVNSSFNTIYDGFDTDAVWFVTFNDEPNLTTSGSRSARQVQYYIRESTATSSPDPNALPSTYRLMRATKTATADAYVNYQFWGNISSVMGSAVMLAENVADFSVLAYDENGGLIPDYDSSDPAISSSYHKAPAWVDVYLLMLGPDHAKRAALLSEAGQESEAREYVNRNGHGYATRVYMRNRQGYVGRP